MSPDLPTSASRSPMMRTLDGHSRLELSRFSRRLLSRITATPSERFG